MKSKYAVSVLTFILMLCASKSLAQNGWITPFLPDSLDNRFYSAGYRNTVHYYAGSFSGHIESTHYAEGARDIFVFTRNFTTYTNNLIQAGGFGDDEALSISVDPSNGSFYVTGYFSGTARFGTDTLFSNGLEDIFLAKYSGSGALLWATSFGGSSTDKGTSVQLQGSNVIVAGFYTNALTYDTSGNTITSNGAKDGFLLSASAIDGSVNWVQTMGGGSSDAAKSVVTVSTGDIFVCGFFTNSALFGSSNVTSAGQSDAFLARYSSAGVLSWVTPIGSVGSDTANAAGVTGSGNNICVTGSFKGSVLAGPDTIISQGGSDCFVACFDAATGSVLWARGSGGPGYDAGRGIAADNTHVFFNATTNDTLYFGTSVTNPSGGSDAYTARYDLLGNAGWIRRDNTLSDSELYGIAASGNYLYTGGSLSDSTSPSSAIVGTVALGWRMAKNTGIRDQSVSPGGMSSMGAFFDQISIGENKSAYAVGVISGEWVYDTTLLHTTNTAYPNSRGVVKVDSTGTFLWMKEIMPGNSSSTAFPRHVEAFQGGGFAVTGVYTGTVRFSSTVTVGSPGARGVFLAKYDAAGNVLWAREAVSGPQSPTVTDLHIDVNGKIYLIGTFISNPTYVDNSHLIFPGVAQKGGYIVRYDGNGVFEWAEGYGSQVNNISVTLSSIETDRSGNMIFAGSYYGQGGFTDLNISGENRSFIAKLSPTGVILWTKVIAPYTNTIGANANHIKCDTSENIYFYFSFDDSAFVSPTVLFTDPASRDAALVKYDPQGLYQWAIHIADTNTINSDYGELQLTNHGEPMIGCTEPSNVTYNSISVGGWTPNSTVLHISKFSPLGTIVSDTVLGYGNAAMYQFDLCDDYMVISGYATDSGTTVCGEFIPGYEPYISYTPFFAALYHDTCSPPIAQFSDSNNGFGLYTFSTALPVTQYLWDFGDGNFDSAASPSHQYTNTGVYTVCLIASNHCGADTFCQQINCAILSVRDEGSPTGVAVFPNPTSDVFTIYSTLTDAQFMLYDSFGREVATGTIASTSTSVDLRSEAAGVYLLKITADDEVRWQKIVRQ